MTVEQIAVVGGIATGALGVLEGVRRIVGYVAANARAQLKHRMRVERWLGELDVRLATLEEKLGVPPRPRARSKPPHEGADDGSM